MKYTPACKLLCGMFFLFLFFVPCVSVVRAGGSLTITEIMYDPSGTDTNREWVEVYNGTSASIDLTKYFLLTDGVGSSRHALVSQGFSSIDPGTYAIIAQDVPSFKKEYPSFSGSIYDSAWTGLTANAGKTLLIVDGSDVAQDTMTYDPSIGANNDGNSLQKLNGTWIAAVPTPGAQTDGGTTTSTTTTSTTTAASGGVAPPPPTPTPVPVKPKTPPRIQATVLVRGEGTTGIPFIISSSIIGYEGENRTYGYFHYALGDGSTHDAKSPEKFEHTYSFPGTYVVTLFYSLNYYDKEPLATARTTIEVTTASVTVSSVRSDGSVLLTNTSSFDTDLSNWLIESGADAPTRLVFQIPPGTMILAGKSVVFPGTVFGSVATPGQTLKLTLPSGAALSPEEPASEQLPEPVQTVVYIRSPARVEEALLEQKEPTPKLDLSANAIGAVAASEVQNPDKKHSFIPFIVALIAIVGLALYSLIKFKVIEKKTNEVSPPSETKAIADSIRIVEE